MSKPKKYADVLPVLAQNRSILHMACTWGGTGVSELVCTRGAALEMYGGSLGAFQ